MTMYSTHWIKPNEMSQEEFNDRTRLIRFIVGNSRIERMEPTPEIGRIFDDYVMGHFDSDELCAKVEENTKVLLKNFSKRQD